MKLKIILAINHFLRELLAYTHKLQFKYQWQKDPNPPEWFDHFMDLYYQMPKKQMSFWLERGVLNSFLIKEDANVLELACGDGFNAKHFYANKAKNMICVDFDKTAIAHATKYNSAKNIKFVLGDIREEKVFKTQIEPCAKSFDNIIFDAAIEHLTEKEIDDLLKIVSAKLNNDGVFSGYTIIERDHVSHHLHEYEFKSKEDLSRLLQPYFKNVKIIYSKSKESGDFRENLYFFATNGDTKNIDIFG